MSPSLKEDELSLPKTGPAVKAQVEGVMGVVLDGENGILFSDSRNRRIRRIDRETGVISTFYPPASN